MVGYMHNGSRFAQTACLVTFIIFSLLPASASGKKDSVQAEKPTAQAGTSQSAPGTPLATETVTLAKIDQLIKQTKYSEALALLAEYIKLYPDNFDAAKSRIDRIMTTRHTYNDVENNLIDLAANNPGEADKNYQMVLKLEKIEQQPSVIHETIRTEVKNLTQFKACQQRFNEIINAAVAAVADKKYAEAAESFRTSSDGKQTAFEVYQEDFIAQNNPRSITQPVDKALLAVDTSITEYSSVQTELLGAYTAFMNAVNGRQFAQAQLAFAQVQAAFTKLAQIRNNTAQAGWQLETIFAGLKKNNPELTDASFLPFASRFILGLEKNSESGILGAMDTQWNELVLNMKNAVYGASLSESEKFAAAMQVDTLFAYPALHDDGRTAVASAGRYADLGVSVNGLNSLIQKKDGTTALVDTMPYERAMKFMTQFSTQAVTLIDQVHGFAQELQKAAQYKEPADRVAEVRFRKNGYATNLASSSVAFASYRDKARAAQSESWLLPFAPKQENLEQPAAVQKNNAPSSYSWDKSYTAYQHSYAEIERQAQTSARDMWVKSATLYAGAGNSIVAEYEGRSTEIHLLLPEVAGGQLQYPAECIAQLEKLQKDIAADSRILTDCRTQLGSGSLYRDSFTAEEQELINAINRLAQISQDGLALAQRAHTQQRNALLANNEAELRYQQAQQALAKENFDSARSYLQQSREKYSESLQLQEDAELRKKSDANLVALGQSITKAENEFVVRDVRRLKNEAKDAYYAGNFDQAETLLTRAETRWQVTNVDKDDELENLKALVNTALSMKTGRVIPPSAPLYPEMSQILSIANQYYTQGQKLMQQGKKSEATEILNQAKQKLNELKLVYPLNQEASLLTLRIDQLLDKRSFDTMFAQKVASARVNYKSNDATAKQQAYSDLVDLYEINPSYSGLKDLITQVEIELGFRKKPVDNTSVKRAASLAAQAKSVLATAGRDPEKLQRAKELALQAKALNEDNGDAVAVLDEVALKVGGQAVVVLSAADEQLYQRAVQELQKNNIIAANTIVQQLLTNAINKRSAKILELQKKVQALL